MTDISGATPWDYELEKSGRDIERSKWAAAHKEIIANRDAEAEQKQREWRERYEAHLKSDKWRVMRARVLKRDGGICQGCLTNKVTQVHHLTYDRMGDEMMFDLVSVCGDCHDRIHDRNDPGPTGF
jgi:5-methylcytosine-specific restriction endonuclease McrA